MELTQYLWLFRVSEFRNALFVRGMIVWGGLRFAAAVAPIGSVVPVAQLALLLLVGFIVWGDAVRRQETRFLANLGISSHAVIVPAVIVPAILELLFL